MEIVGVVKFFGFDTEYILKNVEFSNGVLTGYVINGSWYLSYNGTKKTMIAADGSGKTVTETKDVDIDTLHIEYDGNPPMELGDDLPF
tara:strand:- start:767 stop:1030 length:264 start_codon:yes stop_codon:yes gene_type:complete